MYRVRVFNTTCNNISVILWRSVLLVEKPEYQKKATIICLLYNYYILHTLESNNDMTLIDFILKVRTACMTRDK